MYFLLELMLWIFLLIVSHKRRHGVVAVTKQRSIYVQEKQSSSYSGTAWKESKHRAYFQDIASIQKHSDGNPGIVRELRKDMG